VDEHSIIVSGWLRVAPGERAAYLDGCVPVIAAARAADGCLDFQLSADPIEPDRINVFEHWTSAAAVEAFRGDGVGDDQGAVIRDADVRQHEVARSARL
jgi:quinol monooxygenase YgiN